MNYLKISAGRNGATDNHGNILSENILSCSDNQVIDVTKKLEYYSAIETMARLHIESSPDDKKIDLGDLQSPLQYICEQEAEITSPQR